MIWRGYYGEVIGWTFVWFEELWRRKVVRKQVVREQIIWKQVIRQQIVWIQVGECRDSSFQYQECWRKTRDESGASHAARGNAA